MGWTNETMEFCDNYRAIYRLFGAIVTVCLCSEANEGTLPNTVATAEAENHSLWLFVLAPHVPLSIDCKCSADSSMHGQTLMRSSIFTTYLYTSKRFVINLLPIAARA
jgi:hypothetical protein